MADRWQKTPAVRSKAATDGALDDTDALRPGGGIQLITGASSATWAQSEAESETEPPRAAVPAPSRRLRHPSASLLPPAAGGSPPFSPVAGRIPLRTFGAEHLGIAEIPSLTAHVCSPGRAGRLGRGSRCTIAGSTPGTSGSSTASVRLRRSGPDRPRSILAEPELEVVLVAAESLGILKRVGWLN